MFTDPIQNVSEFGFLPGQSIADLGSGAGHYAMAISKAVGPTGRVYAVDLQADMLERLTQEAERDCRTNIKVILGDIEKPLGTLLKDESVDGVVFSNILFQLEHKKQAVDEAFRILKPGATVGLVEWSDLSFLSNMKSKSKPDVATIEETKQLFDEEGFSLQRSFEAGEHHYGLIFKKNSILKTNV